MWWLLYIIGSFSIQPEWVIRWFSFLTLPRKRKSPPTCLSRWKTVSETKLGRTWGQIWWDGYLWLMRSRKINESSSWNWQPMTGWGHFFSVTFSKTLTPYKTCEMILFHSWSLTAFPHISFRVFCVCWHVALQIFIDMSVFYTKIWAS